jgi:hypothetical protein
MRRLLASLVFLSSVVFFLSVTATAQSVAQTSGVASSLAADDPNGAARRDYQIAAQAGNRDAWENFLKRYPSGLYADLARAQLVRISIITVSGAKAGPERTDKASVAGTQPEKSASSKTIAGAPQSAAPSAATQSAANPKAAINAPQPTASPPVATPPAAPSSAAAPPAVAPPAAAADPNASARRDYELAAQIGTSEAWQAYLKQYPSGFYADLARAQLDKATKEKSASSTAPIKAELTPSTENPAVSSTALSGGALVEAIKTELKRIGCYAGPIDDNWTARQTDLTLKKFAKASGSQAPDKPTTDFLVLLRSRSGRVCPLECGKREVEKDGQCAAKTCASGFELDEDGDCVRQKSRRK